MPGGNRLYHIALGGCLAGLLWISASLAQEAQKVGPSVSESQPVAEGRQGTSEIGAADDAQDEETSTETLTPALNQIEAAIRDLIAQERAAQSQGPKDTEIRDLEAQEGMAFWAKYMFWATFAAVILTMIGIFLIWRTLYHTRRAADYASDMVTEAKATTKAAENTIAVTQASVQRQLRAYMGHKDAHFERTRMDPQGGPVKYFGKNYGNTPAKDVSMYVKIIPGGAPDTLNDNDCQKISVIQTVPPNLHVGKIVGEYFRDNKFFLYGYIDYTDIFECRWRYRFAFDHDPQRREAHDDPWIAHHEHNDEIGLGKASPKKD